MNTQMIVLGYILPMILGWLTLPKLRALTDGRYIWSEDVRKIHVLEGFLLGLIPILNILLIVMTVLCLTAELIHKLSKSDYWQTKLFKDKK